MKAVERRKHQMLFDPSKQTNAMLFDRSKQTNAHEHDEDYLQVDKLNCECGANRGLHLTTLFYNYANPGRTVPTELT